jgi:Fe-S cluster assembly ATP-binding protein
VLEIKNLHASIEEDGTPILNGINLSIKAGEKHAIMGPNGGGKSTLAKVIAGHPAFEVTEGEILFEGQDILEMDPDERAHLGLFLAFQYPVEVPGVNNSTFLRQSYNAIQSERGGEELDPLEFDDYIREQLKVVDMEESFLQRSVNTGFSGGEKKRNEILQMAVLQPKLSVLDETDSGLDIDALQEVAAGINKLFSPEKALLLVTHYQRMLNYVEPDFVHVLVKGKIVKSGDKSLALELEEKGYDWLQNENVHVNGEA